MNDENLKESGIAVIPRIDASPQWQTGWNESHLALPLKQTNRYEQYDCLCMHKGEIKHLVWNCEHECWDEADGDDFYCHALEVTHWMPFPPAPPAGA